MNNLKRLLNNFFHRTFFFWSKDGYRNYIIKNSVKRKQEFLRHNLYINDVETKVKIIWLRNHQMVNDHLIMLKELDYYTCYFINKQIKFDSLEFKISFDIVIVDFNWKVKYLYPNYKPNQELKSFEKYHHIFVFSANSIIALNINIGDTVCPNHK